MHYETTTIVTLDNLKGDPQLRN